MGQLAWEARVFGRNYLVGVGGTVAKNLYCIVSHGDTYKCWSHTFPAWLHHIDFLNVSFYFSIFVFPLLQIASVGYIRNTLAFLCSWSFGNDSCVAPIRIGSG